MRSGSGGGAGADRPLYHLCVRRGDGWASAGVDRLRVVAAARGAGLPAWALALLTALVLLLCGALRLVQLSLLGVDPVELYVLHGCGSEDEKRGAKRLEPLRRRGNFLLVSLLLPAALGHCLVAALLLAALGSPPSAVCAAGFLVFVAAELVPHAVSSGYGFQLAPGLTWLAQVCLLLTCPLSCPLGLILDLALGRDISTCCIRERTMEMIRTSVNDPYR